MAKTGKKESGEIGFVTDLAANLQQSVQSVFSGSDKPVKYAVMGLLSGLHVLIEDVPGVGKTTLACALAQAAGLSFSRIQFTPDMLPGDVLGMNVWNPSSHEFQFRKGAIEAQCILADELNRTSPRTQSAFLEAMQEEQVTIDGVTRALPKPFFMIATQNPVSFAGTFPLPEAELDRFGLSFSIGYPSEEEEFGILSLRKETTKAGLSKDIQPLTNGSDIAKARELIASVKVVDDVMRYIIDIVRLTRQSDTIRLGASPRASVFLQRASQAHAAFEGRNFVMPEDVVASAPCVLSHRILLSSKARLDQLNETDCIVQLCSRIPKPAGL